jgi:hypothetical protein
MTADSEGDRRELEGSIRDRSNSCETDEPRAGTICLEAASKC